MNVILIGGSSNVGKSSVAEAIAAALGWTRLSIGRLARHSGRPWRPAPETVPDEVAQHYLSLSVDELIEDVLRHYRNNVWPKVEAIIASRSNDPTSGGIVLEGSALWPDFATSLDFDKIAAVWLTADEKIFRQRIHTESRYDTQSPRERMTIDKFLERTLAYNARMVDAVNRHDFTLVNVQQSNVPELTQRSIAALGIDDL